MLLKTQVLRNWYPDGGIYLFGLPAENYRCLLFHHRFEYLFNFDNTFEIHDDIEVLKRMGMAFGLEKGQCAEANLRASRTMVPKALEPYVMGKFVRFCFVNAFWFTYMICSC